MIKDPKLRSIKKCWYAMKDRCNNQANKSYDNYGGRGISYSEEWENFETFKNDMGPKPAANYSLERKDNNKGYSKENCKWATFEEQHVNKRPPHEFEVRPDNKAGVRGVYWAERQNAYISKGTVNGKSEQFYQGKDFFEAVCGRKSWENRQRKKDSDE